MSLINDALKRARQAQSQQAPPTVAAPALQPVETIPYARKGLGVGLPLGLTLLALVGLLLVWELSKRGSPPGRITASIQAPVAATESPTVSRSGSAVEKVPPVVRRAPAVVSTPSSKLASATTTAAPAVVSQGNASNVSSTGPATTVKSNPVPALAANPAPAGITAQPAPIPAPAPLKLQGVVYNPRRPSAVINGRTLFVGDRFRGFRVLAIRPTSAVLVGAGRTNVLVLEP